MRLIMSAGNADPNVTVHCRYNQSLVSIALTYNVLDDFSARSSDELSLAKGDRVELIERDDDFGDGWYLGRHLANGNNGLFPEGQQQTLGNFELLSLFFNSLYEIRCSRSAFLSSNYVHDSKITAS